MRVRLPNFSFILNENEVEIVHNYKYLAVVFSTSDSFLTKNKNCIASQANRAVVCLLKIAKALLLPMDI